MKIRRVTQEESDIINMTPLIDMMFILIIFFSVTTAFREEERDAQVALPDNTQGVALSTSPKVVVVNVRKNGTYVVNSQQVTLDEMVGRVAAAVADDRDQKVLIRADEQALHGYVAQAVLACKRAGVKEANIGYKLPE